MTLYRLGTAVFCRSSTSISSSCRGSFGPLCISLHHNAASLEFNAQYRIALADRGEARPVRPIECRGRGRPAGDWARAARGCRMTRATLADALVRALLSLADMSLRAAYMSNVARAWATAELADALDCIGERAEQGDASARECL